jgi:hypothetical protein
MPNVVKVITESSTELAAMDKAVFYFSPKVSLVFGRKHEVIRKSKSMCTAYVPNVTTRHGYLPCLCFFDVI